MATQQYDSSGSQTGKWVDAGGGVHGSWQDAERANSIAGIGGVGGGSTASAGSFGVSAAGFLVVIAIIGPIILGKVVGFIWGLLLKLGFFGKILTTAIMVFASMFVVNLLIAITAVGTGTRHGILDFLPWPYNGMGILVNQLLMGAAVFPVTTWYFLWHYNVVKHMGASVFSNKIKNMCCFIWFTAIFSWLIGFVTEIGVVTAIISTAAAVSGVVYYIIATRPYAREVTQIAKQNKKRSYNFIKIPIMIIVLALTGEMIYRFVERIDVLMQEAQIERTEKEALLPGYPYQARLLDKTEIYNLRSYEQEGFVEAGEVITIIGRYREHTRVEVNGRRYFVDGEADISRWTPYQ